MSFCPNCGKILKMKYKRTPSMTCEKCGYWTKFNSECISLRRMKPFNRRVNEIAVLDGEAKNLRTLPVTKSICPSCGKSGSETWAIAVGSEGTTSAFSFFRCISCGHTRRETE